MKSFRISTDVLRARGVQVWVVQAEDEADALRRFEAGEADIEAEELEVTDIGDPTIIP